MIGGEFDENRFGEFFAGARFATYQNNVNVGDILYGTDSFPLFNLSTTVTSSMHHLVPQLYLIYRYAKLISEAGASTCICK